MDIITGYRGEPHITAEQDRSVNQGTFGEGSYVLDVGEQLRAEIASNTEIRIYDGVISHQGCTARIRKNAYDSVTIANGSQGMKRKDLVVARYTLNEGNGIESIDWVVIQGTPSASAPVLPEPTLGDIQAGDTVADMAMYEVDLDGINITAIVKLFDVHSFASSAEKVAYDNDKSGLNAENVKDAVDEIVESLVVVKKYTTGNMSVAANEQTSYNVDVNDMKSKGYKCVGHVGLNVSGTGGSQLVHNLFMDTNFETSGTIGLRVRNVRSTAVSGLTVNDHLLFIKNRG